MEQKICLHNGTVLSGYATMENCAVFVEDGTIKDVFSNKRFERKHFSPDVRLVDVGGAYIAPGFIDTHIHGYGGVGADDAVYPEIKPENEVVDCMIEMSRLLVKQGVTAFNPTVYPTLPEIMPDAITKIVSAMGREDGAKIMGLHLEGPFLSPSKLGVQRPETVSPVDLAYMEKLTRASRGHIVNMTVAPEIKNMRELALYCTGNGIVLQAGHTAASYENMAEGMQAGIFHTTHMFNAMSKLDQRNPGAVGAILTYSKMSCEIIADGVHVHPNMFKLLAKIKPMDKIVLVTDSLKCTDQETGPFFANGEEMVFSGGLFRRKEDDVIAGSGITMIRGVQNLVRFGFSPEDAVRAASSNPAAVMRYTKKGMIAPGMDADICVFDRDFTVRAVMAGGEIKYSNL
jgi:N-acetylglucosamine-6-phosphate deacetylase